MIPLYRSEIKWEALVESGSANPGLVFDKYPPDWDDSKKWSLPDDAKKGFYNKIINIYKGKALRNTLEATLSQAITRQIHLVETVLKGETIEMQTDWRLVSGLGSGHPYETGFIWHRTLGVPYLPGSSVKGMMRAWAEQWQEDEKIKARVADLFGPAADCENSATGSLIVFDALPSAVPALELDILNPHYQDYYGDPAHKTPPADYLNPVPVFFLTVAAGQDFLFCLAPRPGAYGTIDKASADLRTGMRLLQDALEYIGAGGKTAVGYGLMQESSASKTRRGEKEKMFQEVRMKEKEKEAIRKAAEAKGYIGLAAKMYHESQESQWEMHHDIFYEAAQTWIKLIVVEEDKGSRSQCLDIISRILDNLYPGILNDPDRKKGKKGQKLFYQKPRARELAKQLIDLQGRDGRHVS